MIVMYLVAGVYAPAIFIYYNGTRVPLKHIYRVCSIRLYEAIQSHATWGEQKDESCNAVLGKKRSLAMLYLQMILSSHDDIKSAGV